MTQQLATSPGRALAASTPTHDFKILDVYAGGFADESPRLEALATISAGYKAQHNGRDIPRASRAEDERHIHLHDPMGRAPGLKAALEAGGYRRLTIAFPFDDPASFISQRFALYSSSALLAHGDETQITEIKVQRQGDKIIGSEHVSHPAGTEAYKALVAKCKVATSIYFHLATWEGREPRVIFPDGLGYLRLRSTSRNSIRSLLAQLRMLAEHTHGRIAGVPFELSLDFREVSDPAGQKRMIPVWTIVPKPPETLALSSHTFRQLVSAGLEQGAQLMLPPPRLETVEEVEQGYADGEFVAEDEQRPWEDVDEASDDDLRRMREGGKCNVADFCALYFRQVKGTRYAEDGPRAELLAAYTDGQFTSLSDYLNQASEKEAFDFIEHVKAVAPKVVDRAQQQADYELNRQMYRDAYGEDDERPASRVIEGEVLDGEVLEPLAAPPPEDPWAPPDPEAVTEAEPAPITPKNETLGSPHERFKERYRTLTYGDEEGFNAIAAEIKAAKLDGKLSDLEMAELRTLSAQTRKRIFDA